MLTEEVKKRLIKAIFILKKEDEEISEEELKIVQDLIENHADLADLDRKIVKLRIFRLMTFREITDFLHLEKSHTALNSFDRSTRKIRRSLLMHERLDDGTKRLSDLIKNRKGLRSLNLSQIFTIGQLTDHLKKYGKLKDSRFTTNTAASIIYYLDRDGYDFRRLVTDKDLLEEFEELDRRNYVHVEQIESLLKNCSRVRSVKRITNSYTISSKTEFGSFDVCLSNRSKVRLRAMIKSLENYYDINADIESSKKYERFDYSEKMTRSVSTNSEDLEEALQFLLRSSSTN